MQDVSRLCCSAVRFAELIPIHLIATHALQALDYAMVAFSPALRENLRFKTVQNAQGEDEVDYKCPVGVLSFAEVIEKDIKELGVDAVVWNWPVTRPQLLADLSQMLHRLQPHKLLSVSRTTATPSDLIEISLV